MGNVGKRKDRVSKANYKQRTDGDFTPYKMISEVNQSKILFGIISELPLLLVHLSEIVINMCLL